MCYKDTGMFLAKTWSTVNGKRYPRGVLKKSVWDKERKRQQQKYVAYIGTERKITWEKACEICREKGIELEELQSVKRLRIDNPVADKSVTEKAVGLDIHIPLQVIPPQRDEPVSEEEESDVGFDVPKATPAEMVQDLREYWGLGVTYEDYDDLAYKIDPSIEAEDLRMVEEDRVVLEGRAQERLRNKWRWVKGKGVG